jgi:UDP-N-acetylmuramate dehydrogenase
MAELIENFSLKDFNTFGIEAFSKYFIELKSTDEIIDFLQSDFSEINPKLIMGGGSNLLFTSNFEGIIIYPNLKGIEHINENEKEVLIRAAAGENWDEFVAYCVEHNLGGIENLSLIPGNVGATPIQNIGAYGVEIRELIEHVETISVESGLNKTFTNRECNFGYRDSIFKKELKDKYIVTHVTFRLSKEHTFITGYGILETELDNYPETTIQNIRNAVIKIRQNKLPDPKMLGNAGSFFKNPVVEKEKADALRKHYPRMPYYPLEDSRVKLSAAWLIETCKWKGKRIKNVGTYKKQPLVLVNYGEATGKEILEYSKRIQKAVVNQFAIQLEPEVNIL